MAETIGNIKVVASIDTKNYDASKKQIEKGNDELEKGADKTSKGFSAAWTGAIAGVAAALTTKFLGAITSSVDGAIRRVDTLNNSARTFENMGIGAIESSVAMKALEKSIKGLPTPLDSAVAGMTALTATYGDISKGQKIFSALNNAILGFGGSAAMVDNAIAQLSQLPMDGPLDAQTWNSLRNSGITPVLAAMAKDSGTSVSALKEAFGDGTLTVQDFTDKLIKLNTEGGGGLASLEKIAMDSTKGIGTGFANMQTAITRGLATIIQAIGSENISNAITSIGDVFTLVLKSISNFVNYVKANAELFKVLGGTIAVAAVALTLYSTVLKVTAVYTATMTALNGYLNAVILLQANGLGVARAAWLLLNAAMKANIIGVIITIIGALVGALIFFFTQTKTGQKAWAGFLSFLEGVWKAISAGFEVVVKGIMVLWNGLVAYYTFLFKAISTVFNAIVGFFKEWGATIFAIIWFPFSLALGLIIKNWSAISGFFNGIWNAIMAVFNNVVNFYRGIFEGAFKIIVTIWTSIYNFFVGWWNSIMALFGTIIEFYKSIFTNVYNVIVAIWTPIVNFFANVFNQAWQRIIAIFSPVGSFFQGVWNTITGIFTNIGTAIGNGIGGAFRSVVNTILRFAVGFINDFINAINGAIDTVNNIPGVKIGKIGRLPIPQLATGGVTTGPTLAMIGEGREQEAVLPLSKLDAMLNSDGKSGGDTYQITINANADFIRSENEKREFATMIIDSFNQTRKTKGLPIIGA